MLVDFSIPFMCTPLDYISEMLHDSLRRICTLPSVETDSVRRWPRVLYYGSGERRIFVSHLIGDSVVIGGRTCLVAKWTELRCERFPDGPDRVTWNTKYNLVIRPVRNSGDALDTVAPYLDRSPR